MIQVAVMGYGTVGSGVVEVIEKNKEEINKKSNEALNIKYILDLRDFPGDPYEDKIVHDVEVILNDPEVQIICETMGGLKPAYEFTKRALMSGKSVCTSNKELVATHGPELIQIAHEHTCNYLFEASVGGGIPIIRPLNYSLTAEKIDAISGILNGTTNYILTKMEREGAAFEEVLKEAQEKGYAERNPEADIEGYDACRKIAILSSLMCGKNVRYQDIYTEGITKITADDFKYAKVMDCTIKLLGLAKEENGGLYAMVSPFLISKSHPLSMVNDVFNAVCVHHAWRFHVLRKRRRQASDSECGCVRCRRLRKTYWKDHYLLLGCRGCEADKCGRSRACILCTCRESKRTGSKRDLWRRERDYGRSGRRVCFCNRTHERKGIQ